MTAPQGVLDLICLLPGLLMAPAGYSWTATTVGLLYGTMGETPELFGSRLVDNVIDAVVIPLVVLPP